MNATMKMFKRYGYNFDNYYHLQLLILWMPEEFYRNTFPENNLSLSNPKKILTIKKTGKKYELEHRVRWSNIIENLIKEIDYSSSEIGEARKVTGGDSIFSGLRGAYHEMWKNQTNRMKRLRKIINLILEHEELWTHPKGKSGGRSGFESYYKEKKSG